MYLVRVKICWFQFPRIEWWAEEAQPQPSQTYSLKREENNQEHYGMISSVAGELKGACRKHNTLLKHEGEPRSAAQQH